MTPIRQAGAVRQFTVAPDDDGVRLDRWFKRHLPQVGFATVSRWARTGQVRVDGKRAKPEDRLVCRIVALDNTWHRPFTTLDLASLQSLFDPEELFYQDEGVWRCRQDFDLVGGSDVMKREWIGNAVPGAAATGMAETIGETILLAEQGETFFLSSREIWVKPGALALAVDNNQAAFAMDAG